MKQSFKPLALASAVTALSAGPALAQSPGGILDGSYPSLGAAAFVPYYTVQQDWVTGVHVVNTSEYTQVVKFRLRRAEDSNDVLDFNIILSPYDEWTGTVRGDDSAMEVVSEDKSCTAPVLVDGTTAPVREENLDGAQEGYIEVIGMAQADKDQPISKAAKHVNGVPVSCNAVRSNFFPDAVVANDTTVGSTGTSTYLATADVLKVSYFIRDNNSGIEFGNNARHLVYLGEISDNPYQLPMMTHQKFGLESFATEGEDALNGWDFPDVSGGGLNTGDVGLRYFHFLITYLNLAAEDVMNDWSYNPATGAATDWVINFPGQYAMIDPYAEAVAGSDPNATWDFRQIPAVATFSLYDREEGEGIPGGLDFSPSPAPDAAELPYEVNVVTWGAGPDVLNSEYALNVDPSQAGIDAPYGWASLSVKGTLKRERVSQGVGNPVPFAWCDAAGGPGQFNGGDSDDNRAVCIPMGSADMPLMMTGFAAWERTFDDPDKNYGRIVDHGFTASFDL